MIASVETRRPVIDLTVVSINTFVDGNLIFLLSSLVLYRLIFKCTNLTPKLKVCKYSDINP